jgi:hypothetical protein
MFRKRSDLQPAFRAGGSEHQRGERRVHLDAGRGARPSTNLIRVQVIDNGVPSMSDTRTFSVFVNELNAPPVSSIFPINPVSKENTLTLTVFAVDSDLPANALTFSIDFGAGGRGD